MKDKKLIVRKKSLIILFYLIGIFLFFVNICEAKMRFPTHHHEIKLENEPMIGQITIIKEIVTGGYDDLNAELGCFFSAGLELVNNSEYKISFVEPPVALEKGFVAFFYSGPLKKGETKETVFKVHIPDGKKYIVGQLEIDLGEPEPPEWGSYDDKKELAGTRDGKAYIKTRIRQVKDNQTAVLEIPQDSPPPLRTELKIRTKDRPYYDYYRELVINRQPGKDTSIPVRYLVYTEEETPDIKVTLTIPQGLEFINEESYKVTPLKDGQTEILLYSGPMRFKQCKGFYFKVKALSWKEELPMVATSEFSAIDGKKLIKEDNLVIDLRYKRRLE